MAQLPALSGAVGPQRQITNDALGKLIQSAQQTSIAGSDTLKERFDDAEEFLEDAGKDYFGFGDHNDPASMLHSFVLSNLRDAHSYRCELRVEENLRKWNRMYNNRYSDTERAQIAEQDSVEVWYPLAQRMVRSMVAFLRKTLAGSEIDHPQFDIEPTTIPEPPPQLIAQAQDIIARRVSLELQLGIVLTRQDVEEMVDALGQQLFDEARQRSLKAVARARREVDDKLQEADWGEVFDQMLHTLCIYGTAVIEGPKQVIKKRQFFTVDSINTRKEYMVGFENCDMYRFFFSRDSTTTQDGSYIVYVDKYSKKKLMDLRHQEGYFADAINTVLAEFQMHDRSWCKNVGIASWIRPDDQQEQETGKGHWGYAGEIDVVRYFGDVPGSLLINQGLTTFAGRQIQLYETYEMELEVIGDIVIYAKCPSDPLHERPFSSCQLIDKPGSPYGIGIIEPIEDLQRVANLVWRNIAINTSFAAKPISEIDDALFAAHGHDNEVVPGATFVKNSNETGVSGQALYVHYLESRAQEFFSALDNIVEHAEMLLGLPRFLLGHSNNGGAARTLGGLNQLTSNAFVQIRSSILNIDNQMLKPTITRLHRWVINKTDDQSIFGDVTVVTMGATALLAREVNRERLQALLGTFLPLFQVGLVKPEGIVDILKSLAESHGLDPDRAVLDPEQEQLDQLLLQQQLAQIGGFNGGQAAAATPGGTLGVAGGAGASLANPLSATGAAAGGGEQGVPGLPGTNVLQGVGSILDPTVQQRQLTSIRR